MTVVLSERVQAPRRGPIVYPDSDGQPMADNTKQYGWIVLLAENLDAIRDDFVAGDLLWYPVEGYPKICVAPDVLVAPGRPKGDRGSYMQWREEGIPPKVVIEVLSPSNTPREMRVKTRFYERYGVDEFLIIDPESERGWGFMRDDGGRFVEVPALDGWTSPTLGIRFERQDGTLRVYGPDGEPLERLAAHKERAAHEAERAAHEAERAAHEAERAAHEAERADKEAARADKEAEHAAHEARHGAEDAKRADMEAARAEKEAEHAAHEARHGAEEAKRADREADRARRLAAKLAALGVDPDAI